jgi:hypothetical protein
LLWSFQFISILFLTSIKIKRDYTRIYVHLQKSSWRLDQAQLWWIIQGFNECCRLWWSFSGLRWSMAKRIYKGLVIVMHFMLKCRKCIREVENASGEKIRVCTSHSGK